MRLGRSMVKEEGSVAGQAGRVEGVSHHEKDVDIVGGDLAGHERPEDHKSCQVAAPFGDVVNAREAKSEYPSLIGADTETIQKFTKPCGMHAKW